MIRTFRLSLTAVALAAASVLSADTAEAQWGYYGPGYYGGRSFSFGLSIGPSYSSYYGPSYGYGSAYGPTYGYTVPRYYHGDRFIGGWYGRPRGRIEYDVYTPFGRREVEYRFRRNGRIDVDFDD